MRSTSRQLVKKAIKDGWTFEIICCGDTELKSNKFKEGDEIIQTGWRVGEIYYGGYSQYAKVNADFLVKKPNNITVIYLQIGISLNNIFV